MRAQSNSEELRVWSETIQRTSVRGPLRASVEQRGVKSSPAKKRCKKDAPPGTRQVNTDGHLFQQIPAASPREPRAIGARGGLRGTRGEAKKAKSGKWWFLHEKKKQ